MSKLRTVRFESPGVFAPGRQSARMLSIFLRAAHS